MCAGILWFYKHAEIWVPLSANQIDVLSDLFEDCSGRYRTYRRTTSFNPDPSLTLTCKRVSSRSQTETIEASAYLPIRAHFIISFVLRLTGWKFNFDILAPRAAGWLKAPCRTWRQELERGQTSILDSSVHFSVCRTCGDSGPGFWASHLQAQDVCSSRDDERSRGQVVGRSLWMAGGWRVSWLGCQHLQR